MSVERNPAYDGPMGVFEGYGEYEEGAPERIDHEELISPITLPIGLATLGEGTIADEGLVRPVAPRTFDRYLRYRHLKPYLDGSFASCQEGVIPAPKHLLQILFPAER